MAAQSQARAHCKETGQEMRHPHQQQGPPPPQQLHHSRPSSIVHQQQQHQAPNHSQQQQQHQQQPQGAYQPASHSLPQAYQAGHPSGNAQDNLNYYSHPSPYSTPGATSGYTSAGADTSEMMAAAQMPRPPYPPMSYHTPQSNSPASVASPSQHDQHRSLYGQPPSQHLPQSMYYQPQPQYQPLPHHPGASPYAQHAHHPQQPMTSQPNMMMPHPSHGQMPSHPGQHAQHPQHPQHPQHTQHAQQHAQGGMTGSPRTKIEPQVPLPVQKQQQPSPMQQSHQQNAPQLQSPGSAAAAVNPNAAPGPIPATTPLVVRQDGNGVQWIAFEYSRDRVKMEYTIRCDVESVNTDELSPEFKQENCVYPRACCPKEQYRGNRLMYETDCNRVGWALAQLNVPLRGKRGLIQRAVDSWRNSNQDVRLRSRRVRRMAKMTTRKQVQGGSHSASPHMPGHPGPTGMPSAAGSLGPGSAASMDKPGLNSMGQPMHHHAAGHPGAGNGGEEVGNVYGDRSSHAGGSDDQSDVRPNHVFQSYGTQSYPSVMPNDHLVHRAGGAVPAKRLSRHEADERDQLFPDLPETRRRKFVLVEDNMRGSRLRVRVTLDGVDPDEIPDSFLKGASVYPRSFFPREMQSPVPSGSGSGFGVFADDISDDGIQDTEGGRRPRGRDSVKLSDDAVKVRSGERDEMQATIPRMRTSRRAKEIKLNDLGHRMAWLQSRVFTGRPLFLQRALDNYRGKTCATIEGTMHDVCKAAPHYEMRVGKRRWHERAKRRCRDTDE